MRITIGGIIALIVIVGHIIAALNRYSEKKKKEEAAQRALEARRMQEQGFAVGTPLPSASTSQGMSGMPGNMPMSAHGRPDDLAARRQAQLEQLRQRRESRRATTLSRPSPSVAQPTDHSPKTPPSQQVPTMSQGMRVEHDSQSVTAMRDAHVARQRDLQARQQATQVNQEREAREQRSQARKKIERIKKATEERQREEREEGVSRSESDLHGGGAMPSSADPYRAITIANNPARINRLLRQPGALRQFMVLKEILDPPVSIR